MKFYHQMIACIIMLISITDSSAFIPSSGTVNKNALSTKNFNSPKTLPAVNIDFTQETGGVEPDPLKSGQTGKAILGFKVKSTGGSATLDGLNINFSSDPSGKLTVRLYSSTDNIFDGGDTDTGITPTMTTTQAQFSGLAASITGSSSFYFVVANISSSVSSSTVQLKASLSDADVSATGGSVNSFTINGTNYNFLDIINPTATLSPTGTTAIPTNTSLVLNFSENVKKSTSPVADDGDRVRIRLYSDDSDVFTAIDKTDAAISVSGSTVTVTLPGLLTLGTQYYISFGNDVITDMEGNAYAGTTASKDDWKFTINSGVVLTAPSFGVCQNTYTPVGPIILAESAVNNFNGADNGSRILKLIFDAPGFAFATDAASKSAITATVGGDITGITVSSLTFTSVTFTVNFDASANDEIETITIDGLKVSTDGTSASGHIRIDPSSTLTADPLTVSSNLAIISTGGATSAPTSPVYNSPSATSSFCLPLTGTEKVSLSGTGTFRWYTDATLTSFVAGVTTGTNVLLTGGAGTLNLPTNTQASYSFYVTATNGANCESAPLKVDVITSPTPGPFTDPAHLALTNICPGSALTIGGAPTLENPSIPGAYTYAWTSVDDGSFGTPSVPNPVITTPTPSSLTTYHYKVDITDAKQCKGSTTMSVQVKADFSVSLTSPPNTTLSYQNNPVILTASVPGGSFFGPGVINTGGTNPYSFDPKLVYNVGAGGTQDFDIGYTVTSGGCTKTISIIGTFHVYASAGAFGSFPTQFCSTEFPYANFSPFNPSTYKAIQISSAVETNVLNYVASYNSTRLPAAQVSFNGNFRNYYQGYYGGTVGNHPTVALTSAPSYTVNGHSYPQYGFITDQIYNNCTTCNYAYIGIYVEYNTVEQVVADFGPSYGIVSGTPFDNGYVFYQPGVRSGFYYTGQYVQLNQIPVVSMNGIADGSNICKQQIGGAPFQYTLTGTYSAGFFEMSMNGGGTYLMDIPSGNAIVNHSPNDGTAVFDSQQAWSKISTTVAAINWNSGTSYKLYDNVSYLGKFYRAKIANTGVQPNTNPTYWEPDVLAMIIRYSYPPGSLASDNSTACLAYSSIVVYLHDNPSTINFDVSVAADNTVFCNDDMPITLIANQSSGMTYSGPGVSALTVGVSGQFTPGVANPSGSSQVSSVVTALYTDAFGCQADKTRTFKVNPKITASFTFPRSSYCNEDLPVGLTGNTESLASTTASGQFSITYRNTSNNPVTTLASASATYSFNPKVLYQNTFGTIDNSTQSIDVTYTETLNAGKTCTNSITNSLTIKAPIVLDIASLVSNPIFCSTDPNAPQNNNTVTFQGNVPGFGFFSLDDDNDFSTVNNGTLNGTINTTSGAGTISNLVNAYNASGNAPPIKQVYVQYAYTGPGCTAPATVVRPFRISSPPSVSFSSPTPPANQIFCNDAPSVTLQTSQSSGVNSIISGFGVIDDGSGSGVATFTPVNAYNASIAAGGTINTNQAISINATATDPNGCKAIKSINYTVNKKPDASFTIGGTAAGTSFDICYTDLPVTLEGNVAKSWYSIVYKGTTTPFTETFGTGPTDQAVTPVKFDPTAHFRKSVDELGGNALNTNQYDVIYSAADADNCINTLPPVTFNVAPQLDVDFAGLTDGDAYCSNDGAKPIVFSNFPPQSNKRIFTINGVTIPLSTNTYDFSQQYNKNGGNFTLVYTVLSGANNCVNQITKTVDVLPSPTAQFTSVPKCKEDVIAFDADGSLNTALATTYSWNFQDQTPVQSIGQNVQYSFLSEGVYDVSLNAAFAVNSGKVCQESITKQQVIGGIPTADFTFSNICEGDLTQFKAAASSPAIFEYQWTFDDGETIGFGQGASFVQESANPNSSGIYREPTHRFIYKTTPYNVTLTGRTPASSGGCLSTITKPVSVLKLLTPTPTNIYQMSTLNGGDGYFVSEDGNGNSRWAFGAVSPDGTATPEMAWNNAGYLPNDKSFMNSPCFDMSAYQRPLFAIRHSVDTKPQIDGAVAQFSTDGGASWTTMGGFIGSVSTGLDWYDLQGVSGKPGEQNYNSASVAWSRKGDSEWHDGRHSLDVIPGARNKVRFRIAFGSDQSNEQLNLRGFAFSDVKIDERNRVVLAENFTNNTVSGSAKNNEDFYNFKNNTNELVKLQYHIGLPTSDDINKQNPADANARAGFYGLTNSNALVPKGYLDGLYSSGNFINAGSSTWVDTEFSLRSLVPSPIDLTLTTLPTDNDKILVSTEVKAINPITRGKLALFIAVIEKNVGSDGFVVRKLLPSGSGTPLTLPMAINQQITIAPDAWEVKNVNDVQQLAVVAFVQDIETKEVIQSTYLVTPANLPTVITGLENEDHSVNVYPNPANRDFTIQIPTTWKHEGSIKLADQLGKVVYETTFNAGSKTKVVGVRDLAAGLYILKLESGSARAVQKVMIVHQE